MISISGWQTEPGYVPPQDVAVDRGAGGVRQGGSLFIAIAWKRIGDKVGAQPPVLEIGFGPPTADVGSIWSSQKARKFRHFQKTLSAYFVF